MVGRTASVEDIVPDGFVVLLREGSAGRVPDDLRSSRFTCAQPHRAASRAKRETPRRKCVEAFLVRIVQSFRGGAEETGEILPIPRGGRWGRSGTTSGTVFLRRSCPGDTFDAALKERDGTISPRRMVPDHCGNPQGRPGVSVADCDAGRRRFPGDVPVVGQAAGRARTRGFPRATARRERRLEKAPSRSSCSKGRIAKDGARSPFPSRKREAWR